jgi:acyl-CoA thioesterase-1
MSTLNLQRLPFKSGERILFQGDSITDAGRNRNDDSLLGNGYVAVIRGLLSALRPDLRVQILNRGVSGDRTPELLARWETDCLALKPDWLSIMIGVNDVWRLRTQAQGGQTHVPLPEYVDNYRALLDRATAAGIPHLVLMSPTLIDKDLQSDLNCMLADYDQAVRTLAQEYGAIYVPVRQHLIATIAAHPEIDWLPDGCHPGTAGHTVIATVWLSTLAAL